MGLLDRIKDGVKGIANALADKLPAGVGDVIKKIADGEPVSEVLREALRGPMLRMAVQAALKVATAAFPAGFTVGMLVEQLVGQSGGAMTVLAGEIMKSDLPQPVKEAFSRLVKDYAGSLATPEFKRKLEKELMAKLGVTSADQKIDPKDPKLLDRVHEALRASAEGEVAALPPSSRNLTKAAILEAFAVQEKLRRDAADKSSRAAEEETARRVREQAEIERKNAAAQKPPHATPGNPVKG